MRRFDLSTRLVAALALIVGAAAAWHYHLQHLTLSHYDAKAHLVVARRVLDSLTPGWAQIGAVWLPLPHVVQVLPIQIDWIYRTGAFAVALSVVCYAVTTACIFLTVRLLTGSRAAGGVGATIFAANPNVLYLQSTPMTEPLFFALATLEILLFTQWVTEPPDRTHQPYPTYPTHPTNPPTALGWVMVLACLTRYEAWPIAAAAWVASAYVWLRRGAALGELASVYARLALYPIGAVICFALLSRVTVGEWLVTGGFFVPDQSLLGRPGIVIDKMLDGTAMLGGQVFARATVGALAALCVLAVWKREKSALLIPLALFAAAALPFYAFVSGHPFRIRYEVPLILAGSMAIGLGVGQLRRFAPAVALVLVVLVVAEARPLDRLAPMVQEAQADVHYINGRRAVTRCLVDGYRGETIMASMSSLAPYMQELSAEGFGIGDFLHEGNHPIWDSAYERAAALVGWVLIEEQAAGGDMLLRQQQANPRFLEGFDRVCEGGGVALYRRRDR